MLRRDRVVLGRGHNRTERGSAGSISSRVRVGEFDPALPCSVLLSSDSLVNQQFSFDCSNLRVNHAKAVQLTAASEGDVLYMIGQYFRFR